MLYSKLVINAFVSLCKIVAYVMMLDNGGNVVPIDEKFFEVFNDTILSALILDAVLTVASSSLTVVCEVCGDDNHDRALVKFRISNALEMLKDAFNQMIFVWVAIVWAMFRISDSEFEFWEKINDTFGYGIIIASVGSFVALVENMCRCRPQWLSSDRGTGDFNEVDEVGDKTTWKAIALLLFVGHTVAFGLIMDSFLIYHPSVFFWFESYLRIIFVAAFVQEFTLNIAKTYDYFTHTMCLAWNLMTFVLLCGALRFYREVDGKQEYVNEPLWWNSRSNPWKSTDDNKNFHVYEGLIVLFVKNMLFIIYSVVLALFRKERTA